MSLSIASYSSQIITNGVKQKIVGVLGFNTATGSFALRSNITGNNNTLAFVHSPNFATIHDSLKPTDSKQRTFYGLRNWTFSTGKPVPALQPVEMIKISGRQVFNFD